VKVSQSGYVFISSFGAIQNEESTDGFASTTGHIVGSLKASTGKLDVGGVKSTVLGGEVLVTEFSGEGRSTYKVGAKRCSLTG